MGSTQEQFARYLSKKKTKVGNKQEQFARYLSKEKTKGEVNRNMSNILEKRRQKWEIKRNSLPDI